MTRDGLKSATSCGGRAEEPPHAASPTAATPAALAVVVRRNHLRLNVFDLTYRPYPHGVSERDRLLSLVVDGDVVEVIDRGDSLLGVLRDQLGRVGVKDGCSPQGQCGCCTVLIDGQPRVACVTPARRARGKDITTIDGLDAPRSDRWAQAFCSTGASQCGFCTPGIVLRLDALERKWSNADEPPGDARAGVDQALLAHLCRCTGWQTIREAWDVFCDADADLAADRDFDAAEARAKLEGGESQRVSPAVALGRGGFAADTAPARSLIAVRDGADGWVVGESVVEARALAGKVQGRRTTAEHTWPIEVPEGRWDATLRTTWVEPAYLETDASWCEPGGEPSTPLANAGAFGGKSSSPLPSVAERLANEHGRPVLALASREDSVRLGPKRPPLAGGVNADGSGIIRVVDTPGITEAIALVAPHVVVETVAVPGPPTSTSIRGAGWVEAVVLLAGATGNTMITSPDGASAQATVSETGISVQVSCGQVLDAVTLRSYCIGAAHMAWSWLTSEALMVDHEGEVHDLTIRSFGVLRSVDTPQIDVVLDHADERQPVNGSDAVFAAVAAAAWVSLGLPQDWPASQS